jgi:hypothetical protein
LTLRVSAEFPPELERNVVELAGMKAAEISSVELTLVTRAGDLIEKTAPAVVVPVEVSVVKPNRVTPW